VGVRKGMVDAMGNSQAGPVVLGLPDVNYVGGSRQLRRRVGPPPPAMAGGGPR
jgi:hypothetical protein